jgi:hypothetical protein
VIVLSEGRIAFEGRTQGMDAAGLEAAFMRAVRAHRTPDAIDPQPHAMAGTR